MENELQAINRELSLDTNEVRRNNLILVSVLQPFVDSMKRRDPLFNATFNRIFYGGSYYDGLRICKPEEFDLDLLLYIPRHAQAVLTRSSIPGFVNVRALNHRGSTCPCANFGKLLDDTGELNTKKTLTWMEGLIQRSLNDFQLPNGVSGISFSKSGPALTLHIFGSGRKIMDVDLVPSFVFGENNWPQGFRPNPVPSKPEFFIVPKKPKNENLPPHYWRLSFQEQERAMIDNKLTLKPTLKILKQLRDSYNDKWIASYYIKTVLLHLNDNKNENFWKRPLHIVVKDVLKEYNKFLKNGNIPYYWDQTNLIGDVQNATTKNVSKRLKKIIKKLENKPRKKRYRLRNYLFHFEPSVHSKEPFQPIVYYDYPTAGELYFMIKGACATLYVLLVLEKEIDTIDGTLYFFFIIIVAYDFAKGIFYDILQFNFPKFCTTLFLVSSLILVGVNSQNIVPLLTFLSPLTLTIIIFDYPLHKIICSAILFNIMAYFPVTWPPIRLCGTILLPVLIIRYFTAEHYIILILTYLTFDYDVLAELGLFMLTVKLYSHCFQHILTLENISLVLFMLSPWVFRKFSFGEGLIVLIATGTALTVVKYVATAVAAVGTEMYIIATMLISNQAKNRAYLSYFSTDATQIVGFLSKVVVVVNSHVGRIIAKEVLKLFNFI